MSYNYIIELYWKVHINNFDEFILYILRRYKKFDNDCASKYFYDFRKYYTYVSNLGSDYIYLCVDSSDGIEYSLSYADSTDESKVWFDNNNCRYMGEFISRRRKIEELNRIAEKQ